MMNAKENQNLPWYQQSQAKKVKVKVDMPWGVAAVRGTFFSAVVDSSGRAIVSVLSGQVDLTSGGQTTSIEPGNTSSIDDPDAPPSEPEPMPPSEAQEWQQEQDWLLDRAQDMSEQQAATPSESNQDGQQPTSPEVNNPVQQIQQAISQIESSTTPTSNQTSDSGGSSGSGGSGGSGEPTPTPEPDPEQIKLYRYDDYDLALMAVRGLQEGDEIRVYPDIEDINNIDGMEPWATFDDITYGLEIFPVYYIDELGDNLWVVKTSKNDSEFKKVSYSKDYYEPANIGDIKIISIKESNEDYLLEVKVGGLQTGERIIIIEPQYYSAIISTPADTKGVATIMYYFPLDSETSSYKIILGSADGRLSNIYTLNIWENSNVSRPLNPELMVISHVEYENPQDILWMIAVAGLQEGDIVKVYRNFSDNIELVLPLQVPNGFDRLIFPVIYLDSTEGRLWLTRTSINKEESIPTPLPFRIMEENRVPSLDSKNILVINNPGANDEIIVEGLEPGDMIVAYLPTDVLVSHPAGEDGTVTISNLNLNANGGRVEFRIIRPDYCINVTNISQYYSAENVLELIPDRIILLQQESTAFFFDGSRDWAKITNIAENIEVEFIEGITIIGVTVTGKEPGQGSFILEINPQLSKEIEVLVLNEIQLILDNSPVSYIEKGYDLLRLELTGFNEVPEKSKLVHCDSSIEYPDSYELTLDEGIVYFNLKPGLEAGTYLLLIYEGDQPVAGAKFIVMDKPTT